ncbi:MAG: hypothetical protein AABX30_00455 [Nanoarchaeota archaeon]
MKNVLIFLVYIVVLSLVVNAQASKINIELVPDDVFAAGENITFKISLYDENNIPLSENVDVVIEDAEKMKHLEEKVLTKELVQIDLGELAPYGYWTIIAKYGNLQAKNTFSIEAEELAKFELNGDILTITNIGNIQYSKTVQIIIGNTIGIKEPRLDIGKKVEYRLIAPEGTYNIRITDGTTSISSSNIALTGEVIGILDEKIPERAGLTGGIKPDTADESFSWYYLKKSKFTYIFVLAVFGAAILLAIERRYAKK